MLLLRLFLLFRYLLDPMHLSRLNLDRVTARVNILYYDARPCSHVGLNNLPHSDKERVSQSADRSYNGQHLCILLLFGNGFFLVRSFRQSIAIATKRKQDTLRQMRTLLKRNDTTLFSKSRKFVCVGRCGYFYKITIRIICIWLFCYRH